MPMRDPGLQGETSDQIDLVLENLHRLQRPGEFTPLAAACGWVKKEVPSELIEEIMIRVRREEQLRRCKLLILAGSFLCLLHILLFTAADRYFHPLITIEQFPMLVGSFWVLASLWFSFLLLIGFVLGYGASKAGQEVISPSGRLRLSALFRRG